MKSFKVHLTESQRTYDFKVRLVCDLSEDVLGKIKAALETYKVASIGKPKRLPIQETPEFPNSGPVEIHMFDVSLHYPCNDDQVRALISERCGVHGSLVKVTPANSPYEAVAAGLEKSNLGDSKESVLLQSDMKTEAVPANLVGDARIPELIKELEETRKYEYSKIAGVTKKQPQTTNDVPVGKLSPLGSHKPKLPTVKK